MLVKPKCVWEVVVFFNFWKNFQLFVYNFSKTTASQTHFGFTNIGSEMHNFRGTAIWNQKFRFGSPCMWSGKIWWCLKKSRFLFFRQKLNLLRYNWYIAFFWINKNCCFKHILNAFTLCTYFSSISLFPNDDKCNLFLKLENMQNTNSFKIRGVANQFEAHGVGVGTESKTFVTMSAGQFLLLNECTLFKNADMCLF